MKRRVGQGVKTLPFHGRVTGSIPVRATKASQKWEAFLIYMATVYVLKSLFDNASYVGMAKDANTD